ncbi:MULTISPECIES: outer membrane protein [unclassified Xanthobacter]|uniref:outer membrane protein n=1 Tax=unclassified Xanthobacter TaxID=2623496 RepID=UPI001F298622|nr:MULTISPECIES: outer membrane protein [unclassified Xanthobacter]
MLKRALLGVSALALLAGSASAADLSGRYAYPVKAAVVPVPMFSWTGFYIGGNVGWGWADNAFDYTTGGFSYGYDVGNSNGVFGGLQAGYNFQFANNVVLGAEADLEFSSISNSNLLLGGPVGGNVVSSNVDNFGTIRGRVGYAFDRFLPYFTGGAAWANTSLDAPWGLSQNSTRWGWTIGGGAEYAITNNWTVKAEYLYLDYGNKNVTYINGDTATSGLNMNTVKAGVNYKF